MSLSFLILEYSMSLLNSRIYRGGGGGRTHLRFTNLLLSLVSIFLSLGLLVPPFKMSWDAPS